MAPGNFYSIWAMPASTDGPLAHQVAAIIDELSSKHGTPPFEPHVTVLGGFGSKLEETEVVERTRAVAAQLAPYQCRVADVSCGTTYFQSVYLRMHKDEPVLKANSASSSSFDVDPNAKPAYMPHMSLLYGELPTNVREEIVEQVMKEHSDLLKEIGFRVQRFHLYRTDPSDLMMTSWAKIAEFPLLG